MVKRLYIDRNTGRVFALDSGCCMDKFFEEADRNLVLDSYFGTGLLLAVYKKETHIVQYVERKVVSFTVIPFHELPWYNDIDIVNSTRRAKAITGPMLDNQWEELVTV